MINLKHLTLWPCLVLALAGGLSQPAHAQTRSAVAYAAPLDGITIDADLDDWPADMARYPVLNDYRIYGPTDLTGADLRHSPDLSPQFMVGYDPDENLIYLAAMVRDERLTTIGTYWNTDAIEIYFEGKHLESRQPIMGGFAGLAALQYVGVPSDTAVYDSPENPTLFQGAFAQTGSKFAFARRGDVTIYEWALKCYDFYPNEPTSLEPGKRIGFDVVVVDKDDPNHAPAFVGWGPMGGSQYSNAGLLGDMVFLGSRRDLALIEGRAIDAEGAPYRGLIIEAHQDDLPAGYAMTDDDGRFRLHVPAGIYHLQPAAHQATAAFEPQRVAVIEQRPSHPILHVQPLELPEALVQALDLYRQTRTYQAKVDAQVRVVRQDVQVNFIGAYDLAFDRPQRLRLSDMPAGQAETAMVSDGLRMGILHDGQLLRPAEPAARRIAPVTLLYDLTPAGWRSRGLSYLPQRPPGQESETLMAQLAAADLISRLLMVDDPMKELLAGVSGIQVIGEDVVDDHPTEVVELAKLVHPTLNGQSPWGSGMEQPFFLRLWIDKERHLIRRLDFQYDEAELISGLNHQRPAQPVTFTVTHREIQLDQPIPAARFELPEDEAEAEAAEGELGE